MVVVEGIYSPNNYSSRWLAVLLMGTPDSPVVHRTMSTDCWGLELLTIEVFCHCGALDSPVAHRTVRCDLSWQTVF
jgi:hypothetical protein